MKRNEAMMDNMWQNDFGSFFDDMQDFPRIEIRTIPQHVQIQTRNNQRGGQRRHDKNKRGPFDLVDHEDQSEWDGRKEAFRMFAPGLWEQAEKERLAMKRRGHGHGPRVQAD